MRNCTAVILLLSKAGDRFLHSVSNSFLEFIDQFILKAITEQKTMHAAPKIPSGKGKGLGMLEKMDAFFNSRLEGYDEHQLNCIESARDFYPFTAECLPKEAGAHILDLGCGTGLELEEYFKRNPSAKVTGIDLASGMLDALKKKLPKMALTLILGSYFDVPFGQETFDAAVSVESLHHFTKEEKISLYTKLYDALKRGGFFILTDYFSLSDEEEKNRRQELIRLKQIQCITDNMFYHYDTPLTVRHEKEALQAAGFDSVQILKKWGATFTIKASRK